MADNSQTASLFYHASCRAAQGGHSNPAEQPGCAAFFERYPPLVIIAALWLLFMVFVAVFAPLISPYEYTAIDLRGTVASARGDGRR